MANENTVLEMQRNGILVSRAVEVEKIRELMRSIAPQKTRHDLIRIGSSNDGGYLVPNDLEGIVACFSPGVSDNASFEVDLFNNYGINSHQADFSVNGPPGGFVPLSFEKKFIASHDDEINTTLSSWVRRKWEFGLQSDFLLQMDIEGAEFHCLLATPDELLKRFRIVVLELHWTEQWTSLFAFPIIEALIKKMLQHYVVVHFHPNNYAGKVNVSNYEMPRVIELTLLRKDRCGIIEARDEIRHPLDNPCNPDLPDIIMDSGFLS